MEKILISSCLMGNPVRYDGKDNGLTDACISQWLSQGRLLVFCPEMAGGLVTPRAPAEQQGDRVITHEGVDVTREFRLGAELALKLASEHGVKLAILKAHSPSCGSNQVYDGGFSRTLIEGNGLTAARLKQAGIKVFTELELDQAQAFLRQLEG
ncbi:DUF523 domain-containing protein [Shewanella submarina]|uniref:DUF523 domain-containing protein n=1 Tax=Shewanella submarina TaxID=2016376 RepID=A0ABV7GEA5_9GAMM|nr:DUF523 domain-containing protein [Shewanella submarina]MCL1039454.1 DUF523 domain-containing protein [Shewanella submarina]